MITTAAVRTHSPSLARDLVMLTKPRIISLLLVTTIAPMFVAGTPSLALVMAVAIGGYLMAGGANAVNMYIDRDIDDRMARTRLRPIPGGRMDAVVVLAFGVALATAATALLAVFVSVLAAALALAGFYFYVFVYSRWLKRSTPQNIVIGGAAGAFPLVVIPLLAPLPGSALCGNGRGPARSALMRPSEWRDTLVVQITGKEGKPCARKASR